MNKLDKIRVCKVEKINKVYPDRILVTFEKYIVGILDNNEQKIKDVLTGKVYNYKKIHYKISRTSRLYDINEETNTYLAAEDDVFTEAFINRYKQRVTLNDKIINLLPHNLKLKTFAKRLDNKLNKCL